MRALITTEGELIESFGTIFRRAFEGPKRGRDDAFIDGKLNEGMITDMSWMDFSGGCRWRHIFRGVVCRRPCRCLHRR